jgi:hypothetical protein
VRVVVRAGHRSEHVVGAACSDRRSGRGGRRIRGDYRVTIFDLKPGGLMKLMTPVITRQVRREVAQLDTLKTVLERKPAE